MPVRVFSEENKIEIREKLLKVGFPLLKEYGLTHMSIPKIAKAAGIGTGTFYHFFKSKEDYIYELITYRRKILLSKVITDEVKAGQKKLSPSEVRQLIGLLVDKNKSLYSNLKLDEEAKLFQRIKAFSPNLEHEKAVAGQILAYVDHPKDNIDYALLFNLIKILVISSQAEDELHASAYEKTLSVIMDNILAEIFG